MIIISQIAILNHSSEIKKILDNLNWQLAIFNLD
jgi:hypothetical protein